MILRSGRVIRNLFTNNSTMSDNSDNEYTEPSAHLMQLPDTNAVASTSSRETVRHEFVQRVNDIPKFTGTDRGPDLEAWIQSVEDYLNTRPNLSESQKLMEAKTHLEPKKKAHEDSAQHVSFVMTDWRFGEITTWTGLKTHLRGLYASVTRENVVTSLSKIIREVDGLDTHYMDHASQSFVKLTGWMNLVSSSEWVDDENRMNLKDVATLLQLALTLKYLPEELVSYFKPNWTPRDGVTKLKSAVEKNLSKVPNINMVRIVGHQQKNKTAVAVVNNNTNSNNNLSRPESNNKVNTGLKPKFCNNCQKVGHVERECYARPYCTHHKTVGHRNDQCRSLNNQNYSQTRANRGRTSNNFNSNFNHQRRYPRNQGNASRGNYNNYHQHPHQQRQNRHYNNGINTIHTDQSLVLGNTHNFSTTPLNQFMTQPTPQPQFVQSTPQTIPTQQQAPANFGQRQNPTAPPT